MTEAERKAVRCLIDAERRRRIVEGKKQTLEYRLADGLIDKAEHEERVASLVEAPPVVEPGRRGDEPRRPLTAKERRERKNAQNRAYYRRARLPRRVCWVPGCDRLARGKLCRTHREYVAEERARLEKKVAA